MIPIDVNTLIVMIAPPSLNARQGPIVSAIGPQLAKTLDSYEINTVLRVPHFLAQIAHESDSFNTCKEYATGGAYEGRKDLGNTQTGDGPRYKGRGLIQLTGRANYQRVGDALGIDLINFPERAEEPIVALLISCEFWRQKNINATADRDDLLGVTRLVNGGLNGLDQRRVWLGRAKHVVQATAAKAINPSISADEPTLHRGMRTPAVADFQQTLSFIGWPVAIDGDFGPGTETAVRGFQRTQSLTEDGIVGPMTYAAIRKAYRKVTGVTGAAETAERKAATGATGAAG